MNNIQRRKRWTDIGLMVLFGGLLVAAIVRLNGWVESLVAPPPWVFVVWFALTLLVWTVLAVFSGWSLSFKGFWAHPPTALAVIFGYALYQGVTYWSLRSVIISLFLQFTCWSLGKFFVADYYRISKTKRRKSPREAAEVNKLWFMDDGPIADPENDRFKTCGTEKRVVHLIAEEKKNVAVLGKYGSGKSTIIKWAERKLETEHPEYVICRLGAWGRRREGFSSHLLKMGTAALKPHLDVLSFIDVPVQYHAALSSKGFWGELFAAAFSSRDPADVLVRLDEALGFAGKKLLFVVEDVDRNLEEALLKEELPALLDRIDNTENIQFMLAVDVESVDSTWLLRVASCVDVPVIEPFQVQQELEWFRSLIFNNSWIDPIIRKKREEWFSLGVPDHAHPDQVYLDKALSTRLSLVNLLTNPREFKAVLRETWEKWTSLKGEVDPDDLLVLTSIKLVEPTLYQLILNSRARFCEIAEETGRREGREKEKDAFIEQFKRRFVDQGAVWQESFDTLLNHLFLHWKLGPVRSLKERPQSIAIRSGLDAATDYWNRVQRVRVVEPVCDQVVLKLMQDSVDDLVARKDLAEKVYSEDIWAKKVEQFGELIWGEVDIRSFAGAYFNLLIDDPDVDRHEWNIPGWDEVMSLMPSSWSKDFDGQEWWFDHAVHALQCSLNLARKIMHSAENENRYGLKVSKQFYEYLKDYWTKVPEVIARIISEDSPHALHNLMLRHNGVDDAYPPLMKSNESEAEFSQDFCLYSDEGGRTYGFRVSDWQWLIDPLFKAIEINAELLLPVVSVSLVCPKDFFNKSYVLSEEFIQKWIGPRQDELASWLVRTDASWPKEHVKECFEITKNWAKRFLNSKNDSHPQ